MKRLVLSTVSAALMLMGCSKIKRLADINVDIPYETELSVPAVDGNPETQLPVSLPLSFPATGVETNSKENLSKYGTATNLVTTVYLKSLSLQIKSPAGKTFNFLDNVQVYISAEGLPEQLVAYQYNIPKGRSVLDLATNTDVNLKEYYLKDIIYLRMITTINAIPPTGVVLGVNSVFHMVANPLN